jgi:hypothetical protein
MVVCTVGIVLGLELFLASSTVDVDRDTAPEVLPAPKQYVAEPQKPALELLPYERINRYDIWQYYAVDRKGTWRPRVLYSPYGAFYLYNGASYPYTPIRPLNFMPYVLD